MPEQAKREGEPVTGPPQETDKGRNPQLEREALSCADAPWAPGWCCSVFLRSRWKQRWGLRSLAGSGSTPGELFADFPQSALTAAGSSQLQALALDSTVQTHRTTCPRANPVLFASSVLQTPSRCQIITSLVTKKGEKNLAKNKRWNTELLGCTELRFLTWICN